MRDSKKAVVSTVIILLGILLLSAAVLIPSMPYTQSDDSMLRDELAGSLDFLVIGASQAQYALSAEVLDRDLGCNSYNLASDAMSYYEKNYLLQKELDRNDVDTVVLELAYDTLYHDAVSYHTDANIYFMQRLDTFPDRARYIGRINLDNKLFVYSVWMSSSLLSTAKRFASVEESISESVRKRKGSLSLDSTDHRLSDEEIVKSYEQQSVKISDYKKSYVNAYIEQIRLCRAHNARVIIAAVPVSDNYIWTFGNLDEFNDWAKKFCAEQNVEYYDFNLLKDRYSLFSDKDCFSTDSHHLSAIGSEKFTEAFAEIIKEAGEGADVSDRFYPSYSELKNDSPYMAYYLKQS